MRYGDPTAFRAALTDHLRNQYPGVELNRLLKRAMMERFLARTAVALPSQALLKGGYALELRLQQARATQDIDLTIRGLPVDALVETLRDAAELDLDDHLSFRIEEKSARMPEGAPAGGERLVVTPLLGGKRFQPFPLDVGLGDATLGKADILRGGIDLSFAGLPLLEVPAIPVEVHLAEKLHALSVPRPDGRPNTRVKDLIDVILLQRRGLPAMAVLRTAVDMTFELRSTHSMPQTIEIPVEAWETEYQRFARQLNLIESAPTVQEATQSLNRLVRELKGTD